MRRWKAAKTGQWLLAIGVSLAVNGALLLMLAWSPWTGPRLPPPVVEITILRAPQRLPRPPEPEPPRQPPPTTVTARAVMGPITGPTLAIPSSSTPARPGPAAAAPPQAQAQAQAPRPLNLGCLGRDPAVLSPEERRRCQQQTAQRYPAPSFGERTDQEIAPVGLADNRRLPDNVNIRQGVQGNPLGLPPLPGVGVVIGYDKDNKYFLPGRKTDRRVFQRAEIYAVPEPTN